MADAFARVPDEVEAVVAPVRREAEEECPPDGCALSPALDACVQQSVDELWTSRIKTFVPLLALRRVRGCIRTGTCDGEES